MTFFGMPSLPIVLIVGGVINLLVAMAMRVYVTRLDKKGSLIERKWRQVQVKIISSTIVESEGEDGTMYAPQVRYEYTVDGTRWECDRISLFPKWSSSNRERSRKVIAEYPPGRAVSGWVNPENLSEAVINPAALPPHFVLVIFLILVGTSLLMIPAGALVWIFRPSF